MIIINYESSTSDTELMNKIRKLTKIFETFTAIYLINSF